MSREQIVNKSDPPKKSEWFGFKYRVNPETSKLLQEAVFRDGGDKVKNYLLDKPYLFVSEKGVVTWVGDEDQDHFNEHRYTEKEPPQPKGTTDNNSTVSHKHVGLCEEIPLTSGPIEGKIHSNKGVNVKDYLPLVQPEGSVVKVEIVKPRPKSETTMFQYEPNLNFLNQQEESNMSNANRRVVNVKLLDNDSGLPVENALVAQFDNIVTEDSNDVVVQEILLNKNIADAIAKHNQKRVEQTDLEILKRTGNDVKLRPVKLKDLTWVVTTA